MGNERNVALQNRGFRRDTSESTSSVTRPRLIDVDSLKERRNNNEALKQYKAKYPGLEDWTLDNFVDFERNAQPVSVNGQVYTPSTFQPRNATVNSDYKTEDLHEAGRRRALQELDRQKELKLVEQAVDIINHPYNPIGWIPGLRTMVNVGADLRYSTLTGETFTPYTVDAAVSALGDGFTVGSGIGPMKSLVGSYVGNVSGGLIGEQFDNPTIGLLAGALLGGSAPNTFNNSIRKFRTPRTAKEVFDRNRFRQLRYSNSEYLRGPSDDLLYDVYKSDFNDFTFKLPAKNADAYESLNGLTLDDFVEMARDRTADVLSRPAYRQKLMNQLNISGEEADNIINYQLKNIEDSLYVNDLTLNWDATTGGKSSIGIDNAFDYYSDYPELKLIPMLYVASIRDAKTWNNYVDMLGLNPNFKYSGDIMKLMGRPSLQLNPHYEWSIYGIGTPGQIRTNTRKAIDLTLDHELFHLAGEQGIGMSPYARKIKEHNNKVIKDTGLMDGINIESFLNPDEIRVRALPLMELHNKTGRSYGDLLRDPEIIGTNADVHDLIQTFDVNKLEQYLDRFVYNDLDDYNNINTLYYT